MANGSRDAKSDVDSKRRGFRLRFKTAVVSDSSDAESEAEESMKEVREREMELETETETARGKGKRARSPEEVEEEEADSCPKRAAFLKKAPPGNYQGMSRAKGCLRGEVDEDFVLDLDSAVEGGRKSGRLQERLERDRETHQEGPLMEEALEGIRSAAEAVRAEVQKSSNLSGKVVGRINTALREIAQSVEEMKGRKEGEEMRSLRADNKRMREQLAQLSAETKALRTAFSERKAELQASGLGPQAEPQPLAESQLPALLKSALAEMREDLKRDITITAGEMLNARLEEIRQRLPPAPILRPSLQADRRAAAVPPPSAPPIAVPAPAAPKAQNKPKPKPKSKPSPSTLALARPQVAPPPPPLQHTQETWTNVVGRKAQMKAKKAAAAASQPPSAGAKVAPKPKAGSRGLTLPSTAGIVVALKPSSEASYASILTKATTSFSLAEVGLDHVRMRKTADGARILEVSRSDGGRAAERLCEKLKEIIGEEARIYQPVKMAGLRVLGLIETATPEAVTAAIAAKGGCTAEEVRVGAIREGFGGSGSTLVRCPVTAARKVCEGGRITIGWSSARVEALEPIPLRCFKCMGLGHTRAMCSSEVERGDLCFRCSKPGHKAASCLEAAFCAVCHHGGRPAGHLMGGQACNPAQTRGRATPVRTTGRSNTEGNSMDL